jgi:hypothetical protein
MSWLSAFHRPPRSRLQSVQLSLEQLESRLVPSAPATGVIPTYDDHVLAASGGTLVPPASAATGPSTLTSTSQIVDFRRSTFSIFEKGTESGTTLAASPSFSVVTTAATYDHVAPQSKTALTPLDNPASGPYDPQQVRQAYGFNQITFENGAIPGDGRGQTIAIVDAYDDPNIGSDLHNFDLKVGLPDPSLSVASETLNGQPTGVDPSGGWEMEEALDVEWAHAMAPGANILLVEAYDPSQLINAVQYAASQPGVSVVSMSWGGSQPGESVNDSSFTTPQGHAGVTFVAAAGDHGTLSYPASSPNVLAVGGTTLSLDASGNYLGETVWNGGNGWSGGGGQDPNYPVKQGPDVAYNAGAPVWVYDSFGNSQNPWQGVGGTSAGSPQWAALIAIADQGRALDGLSSLDGPSQTLPMLYGMPSSAFHTNIPGSNQNGISGQGVIGLGSPYADRVVAGLSDQLLTRGTTSTTIVSNPNPPPALPPPPAPLPPNPFNEVATDAVYVLQGLETNNFGLLLAGLQDFQAVSNNNPQLASQLQPAFFFDLFADLGL